MKTPLFAILLAVVVVAGYFLVGLSRGKDLSGMIHYQAPAHGLAFNYPESLFLYLREGEVGESPQLAIALVTDTPAHRAFLAGEESALQAGAPQDGTPLEAPPLITVEVYRNSGFATAAEWIAASTNWIIVDKPRQSVQVAGRRGLLFYWDGLYAGKSVVLVSGQQIYVFSVNWISENDELLEQFNMLLDTVVVS